MTIKNWLICLSTLLCLVLPVEAATDSIWPQAVRRASNDRDADLLAELIRRERYQDAETICRSSIQSVAPESDDAAIWTIRLSQVLAAAQMTRSVFDDAQVSSSQQPVRDLLRAYPQHRRHLFLQAQQVAVQRDAAQYEVVATSVSPATEDRIDRTMTRLLRATAALLSLSDRVGERLAQLNSERGIKEFALISDLVRLQQELQVDAVSLSLMQTELFPRRSKDQLAAAIQAESAAVQAATKLPADSIARSEVERLRIEAIIRGEQFERAESALLGLVRSLPKPTPANVQAMQVRVDIARGRMKSADGRLQAFYGRSPETAPGSIEMDLAKLEFLLSSESANGQVGQWLDLIERRNGQYARRRGEAISLGKLRSGGSSQAVDPSLVAAQGEDWIRRGDPARAGELFSAAAMAELDGDRAIRHASQAAAAFIKAQRPGDAADILAKVAMAKRDASAAPAAHLQAAVSYASSGLADTTAKVEAILLENLQQWPTSEHASAARRWLIKLLLTRKRHVKAAEIATRLPAKELTDVNLDAAVELWQTAIRSSAPENSKPIMLRCQESFRPLLNHELARLHYRSAAAYLLDREYLTSLPPRGAEDVSPNDNFSEQLLSFRIAAANSAQLPVPPQDVRDVTAWRLMRDGRDYPRMRSSIANSLNAWPNGSEATIEHAERLIWLADVPAAVKILEKLIGDSDQSGTTTSQAATLLGSSDQPAAKTAAIEMWDRLAAGIPQGSELWHVAKLSSIRLLIQTGKREDARRRAKYILLTAAPTQADLKQQYESASQPD